MDRYQTKRYVAIHWPEAVRLAQLDGTLPEEIRCTEHVELLHRTEWWAWWSDRQLTMAIGLPEELQPQGLSTDAVELITDVWCSESPAPSCGWQLLAQVQRVVRCEPTRVGDRPRQLSSGNLGTADGGISRRAVGSVASLLAGL